MSHVDHEQDLPLHVPTVVPVPSPSGSAVRSDRRDHDEIILAGESALIPNVPAKESHPLQGQISQVKRGPRDLGLSISDWADLDLGENDE